MADSEAGRRRMAGLAGPVDKGRDHAVQQQPSQYLVHHPGVEVCPHDELSAQVRQGPPGCRPLARNSERPVLLRSTVAYFWKAKQTELAEVEAEVDLLLDSANFESCHFDTLDRK